MNAKITLTVPVEKIHEKVAEILHNVAHDIEQLRDTTSDVANDVANKSDIMKQIEVIDRCRKHLALLDANLEDCYSILLGYVTYKTKIDDKQNKTIEKNNVEQNSTER